MNKLACHIRDREILSKTFAYIVLLWGTIGIGLQTMRSLLGENPLELSLITHFYFTTQSNILISIVAFLFLFKKKKGRGFTTLAFISLVNITITGIIFHVLLTPYMGRINFTHHVLHTINPLLYFVFYFFVINDYLEIRKFWVSLIYPLIYLAFVYLIIEPIFGDLMERIMTNFASARYVYPFLDPAQYERGVIGLIIFNLGLLAPLISLLSLLLCYLKARFEKKLIS